MNLQHIKDNYYLKLQQQEQQFIGTVLILATRTTTEIFNTNPITIEGKHFFYLDTVKSSNIFKITEKAQAIVANFEKFEYEFHNYDPAKFKSQLKFFTSTEEYKLASELIGYKVDFSEKALERFAKIAYLCGYEVSIKKRREVEYNNNLNSYINE